MSRLEPTSTAESDVIEKLLGGISCSASGPLSRNSNVCTNYTHSLEHIPPPTLITEKMFRYGPSVLVRGSHSFTCHEPYLPLLPSRRASPPFGWYSLHLSTEGWPGWVDLGGWLYTEIDFLHLELNPGPVPHPSTNRARRRLTSLLETNAPLYAKPSNLIKPSICLHKYTEAAVQPLWVSWVSAHPTKFRLGCLTAHYFVP